MADLSGLVVVISGGARGQGASHAQRLASQGARVLIGDVLDDEGAATAAALQEQGLAVTYRHLDVTDPGDWAGIVAQAQQQHGGLDVLINNAGIVHHRPMIEESLTAWNTLLAVNLTGVLLGMQAAVPAMRERGGGSIINVASIFGVGGSEGYAAYSASKGAVIALTKTAALELAAERIRVNALCPGGVSTPMNANEPGGGVVPLTPMGRRADVAEISGVVAFLAGPDSSFLTGSQVVVDGGYLAR